MEANNSKKHVVTHLLLILGSIVMLFPFLWMILSSFKTVGEQMSIPMKILPGSFGYLENYKQALEAVPFLRLYLNTILMILGARDLRGHIFQYGRIWICQDGISV